MKPLLPLDIDGVCLSMKSEDDPETPIRFVIGSFEKEHRVLKAFESAS